LLVTSIQTLVTIYSHLKDKPEIHYINLWGPNSDRYPVQIYTHALGRLENPGQYEFHEVDEEVTLVVCDDMEEVRKIQSDVDPDGIVEDLDGGPAASEADEYNRNDEEQATETE
jgi:hypothetical protein